MRTLALAMASVLAGCGTVHPAEPSTRPSAIQTPYVTEQPTLVVTPATSTHPLVGHAELADAAGDLVHESGDRTDRPSYVDIEHVAATTDGDDANFSMTVREEPPATRLNSVERLRFYFALDTTGDGRIDYLLNLENYSDGSFRDGIEHLTGAQAPSRRSTFEMSIKGDLVVATLPLVELGSPTGIEFCAFAMSAEPGGGPVFVKDYAPDGFCEGEGVESDRQMLKLT